MIVFIFCWKMGVAVFSGLRFFELKGKRFRRLEDRMGDEREV